MPKDYYSVLGVSKTSSDQDIKQAYRKLSRELHPDKHKGDKEKEAKFKEVNEAYEVLSDPKKKQTYDQFGSADGPFAAGGGGFGGFQQGFGGFDFDASGMNGFGDIFESFFGGNTGRRARKNDNRGRDVEVELTVPFTDAVHGAERDISFRAVISCETCKGTGAEPDSKLVECKTCSGTGQVTRTTRSLFGAIQQTVLCDQCRGSGKIPEKPCKSCGGEGRKQGDTTVKIRVPAGIQNGQSLRVTGEGEAGRQGGGSGDLFVRIRVQDDPRFQRDGDDIRTTLTISVPDAVLGRTVAAETVHGSVDLHVPAGMQPGQVLRMKGKGMPILSSGRHGDHYVTVEVEVPRKLDRRQRELYEELRKTE